MCYSYHIGKVMKQSQKFIYKTTTENRERTTENGQPTTENRQRTTEIKKPHSFSGMGHDLFPLRLLRDLIQWWNIFLSTRITQVLIDNAQAIG